MPLEEKSVQEIVIIIERKNFPSPICIRRNGHIEYFKLIPLTYAEHAQLHGADKAEK